MDKQTSFLLIIIIIFMTYVYCSNQTNQLIEGQTQPDAGTPTTPTTPTTAVTPTTTPTTGTAACPPLVGGYKTLPCHFQKDPKCEISYGALGKDKKKLYYDYLTDYDNECSSKKYITTRGLGVCGTSGEGWGRAGWGLKYQCGRCIQGNKKSNSRDTTLSNIKTPDDGGDIPSSSYAYDYCDAIVSECKDPWLYAHYRQEWDNICKDATTTANKSVCYMMDSYIGNLIMDYIGTEPFLACALTIKKNELAAKFGLDFLM